MSTHAEVFVELPDGSVTGTYVHYDGYPDTCGRGMHAHSYEAIKSAILKSQKKGGLRFVGPDKIESFDDKRPCIISKLTDARERYVYIKRIDGGVDAVLSGHRAAMFPASNAPIDAEELSFLQLSDFLQTRCGNLCMDNADDANKCASNILSKFTMARK